LAKSKKPYYIQNGEFLKNIIEYRETGSKESWELIGKTFILLSERLSNSAQFVNYTEGWKTEMKSDACYYAVKYFHNYDTDRKNPFAYFTRIMWNAFLQVINKEKKRNGRRIEYRDKLWDNIDYEHIEEFK